ncbi:MAG: hypothetical protein II835_03570 [Fibrobacter sp.]|nr:hypothetical protein [Fibrobacter sp.]
MRQNHPQATPTQINKLIATAQTAPTAEASEKAIHDLWEIFGDDFTDTVAKKSYLIDSDFSLKGYSLKDRRNSLASYAYILFCKVVKDYEPSRKVPFEAYFAKIGGWRLRDEKRKNSKRSKREELEKDAKYSDDDESYSRINNCDVNPFTGERNVLESDSETEDSIARIRERLADDPKVLHRFDVMYELCRSGEYSDAEAARRLGCKRPNMKNVKKSIMLKLISCGLEYDCRLLMAA